jgi:hypothetical protein
MEFLLDSSDKPSAETRLSILASSVFRGIGGTAAATPRYNHQSVAKESIDARSDSLAEDL